MTSVRSLMHIRSALPCWLTAAACTAVLTIVPARAAAQEYAIVDTDMGVLNDDAVALFMLLNSPSANVLGVTIVPGNSWMEHGTAAALRQLELIGRQDIPIVVPLDIAERVHYSKAEYDRIVAAPETPITKLFRQLHGPRFERDAAARSYVWDALTTAVFLQPSIATRDDRFLDIEVTYGPNYGRSIGYHQSRRRSLETPADFPAGTQKVKVLMDVDRKAFWDLYVDLMTRRR